MTLNNLIQEFKTFADKHMMINDFGYGESYDIGTTKSQTYPLMWVSHSDDNNFLLENNIIPEVGFDILFLDKTNNQQTVIDNGFDSSNVAEIMNDQFEIIQHFLFYIKKQLLTTKITIVDANAKPTSDDMNDILNGWILTIKFRLPYNNCSIPLKP